MRNLAEYPVTYDEVYDTLTQKMREEDIKAGIGGIQIVALGLLRGFIADNQPLFEAWLDKEQQT